MSISTVPQAQMKNTFSVAMRVMMKLLMNRPNINSINPPNDNAQVACDGVRKLSSVIKLMKKVLMEISDIS